MKILSIFLLAITSLMTSASHDAFVRYDNLQTEIKNESFPVAPSGNMGVEKIPQIARMKSYARAFLSGEWLALLHAGDDTNFAITVGENKLPAIMEKLKNEGLLQDIVEISKIFDIDPLHILGPIIGENVFNGAIDRSLQDSLLGLVTENDYRVMSERMELVYQNEEAKKCLSLEVRNYWKWRCVLIKSRALNSGSNRDFIGWFYQRSKAGNGTFGIGQVQPFLLWAYNDQVSEALKKINLPHEIYELKDIKRSYEISQNETLMIAYIAAIARQSIDVYKVIGGIDISSNPGLTTTLYNLGDVHRRAFYFKESGKESPSVNYMGWFINKFESQIRAYLK